MRKILLIVISLVFLLTACSSAQPQASGPANAAAGEFKGVRAVMKQQPIQPVNGAFVKGINAFGFNSAALLYDSNENLAFSPVSLELALSMTRMGAAGTTADEMANALNLSGISDDDIKSACRSLIWRANTGGMECANSIWLKEGYPFSGNFLSGCTEEFMADAFPLVIPGAMDAINSWAGEKTHKRINDIIQQEIPEDTPLVLCNALYYLGDWETPFEAAATHDGDFTTPGGPVTVPFMHSERDADYYSSDKFSMLSLPFKSGEGEGRYAMAFLLPAEGSDLEGLLASLDSEDFSQALSGLNRQTVRVKLPKFEYSFFKMFNDTLESLGMKLAFNADAADFSNMTDSPNGIYIGWVLHKCYIRVDELGAEAAAVTAVVPRSGGLPPEGIVEFYADRPFLFAIYSQEDGTIAFLGAVNDPSAK